jgi:hypothetical protein
MAWLVRAPFPPAGILASRRQAQPALLRMFGRARRHNAPLLLARLAPPAAAPEAALQRFATALAGDVRLTDLAWREADGGLMLLLEGAGAEQELRQRLQQQAATCHLRLDWRAARFPDQGLTLERLLETVAWPR